MPMLQKPKSASNYCVALIFTLIIVNSINGLILHAQSQQGMTLQFSLESTNAEDFVLQRGAGASSTQPPWFTTDSTTQSTSLVLVESDQTPATYRRAVYKHPLQFRDASGTVPSFQINASFVFTTFSSGTEQCTEGMAFFIAPNVTVPQPDPTDLGQVFGLVADDRNFNATVTDRHLFAVEFDGLGNPDLHDPNPWSHIGIDINSLVSAVTVNTNDTDLSLYHNRTFYAWMEYDSSRKTTSVWVTVSNSPGVAVYKPERDATLRLPSYDLSNTFLDEMYVGVSAAASSSCNKGTITVYAWSFSIGQGHLQQSGRPIGTAIIAASVAAGAICLLVIVILSMFLIKRRQRRRRLRRFSGGVDTEMINLLQPRRYSKAELTAATLGFSEERKLGEGGFSCVYRGVLKDGTEVAVKRLKKRVRMESEFAREAQIISQIKHRNLLQLQGWCYGDGEAMLVYPLMEKGSLEKYIFKSEDQKQSLDGDTRYRILMGVASALEYLHEGALGECVLHRDVKPANVLLTENYEAKLGDFGLTRLVRRDQIVTVTAAGTMGYVAPEVMFDGRANDKADVYSFGAMALEVACGRPIVSPHLPEEEASLIKWLWSLQRQGKLINGLNWASLNIDSISRPLDEHKWRCVLHLGLLCCSNNQEQRPSMRQVHSALSEIALMPLPASPGSVSMSDSLDVGVSGSFTTSSVSDQTKSSMSIGPR